MNTDDPVTVTIRRRVKPGARACLRGGPARVHPEGATLPRPPRRAGAPADARHFSRMGSGYQIPEPAPLRSFPCFRRVRRLVCPDPKNCSKPRRFTRSNAGWRTVRPARGHLPTDGCRAGRWRSSPGSAVNVAVIGLALPPHALDRRVALVPRSLLTNALVVALLTWVIMPLLSRLFRPWLFASRPDFSAAPPLKKGP